ncbi:MAG: signal transduction protein, partial [Cyanobacteria bacterium P01_G01_bin.49]
KELANNPLLLTLLCLEFEDSGNFPSDRADLYARATNTLLRKWDDKRYIYRQQIYKKLTPKRKEGLLSQIAFKTFDNKEYFFKQRTIERYIGEYICNLPNAPKEQTSLDIDSQAVLKSIEGQHGLLVERARGIYSFSHLTFQEYFTARKIANISNPNQLEIALINLANYVTEKRWREVFLLTATLLEPADRLLILMKRNIDELIAKEAKLQKHLTLVNNKSNSVEANCKNSAIRACYFSLSLSKAIDKVSNEELLIILEKSKKLQQLLTLETDSEPRDTIIKIHSIPHEWNFNRQQRELLNQYLTANQLLVDCLNSECYISRQVREEIENTLLLPFADLNYD